MSAKYVFATLGIIGAVVSIFWGGLPVLAGGVAFIGIAHFVP